MTTAHLLRTGGHVELARLSGQLSVAHGELASTVAMLDVADADVWSSADPAVSEAIAEANAVTEALGGTPLSSPAVGVPPVVRVRELAGAQRRLGTALVERRGEALGTDELVSAARGSVERVTALGRWLGILVAAHAR